ncbi:unnamed protein product [Schistosoma margrebowiei]|uniref:Stork_head domain-containing protein n=1 Tax=Schistosoma margrebowiei TaxID=48269 RepID=A0AA84Z9G3_9TREM|nr:unnamed protein product [Schistosoma margrebowiei]
MSLSSDRAKCLAVTFCQHVQPSRFALHVFDLFISFKYINVTHQNNSWLSQAIQNCYLIGHVEPYLLLIGGSSAHLRTIKLSWDRGQLKSPFGFSINSVSDAGSWFLETSQFNAMRLEEVICQLVWQVTQSEPSCSVERLVKYLEDVYRGIQLPVPSLNDVNNSLAVLTQAGAIYFSGHGYNLLTPEKLAVAKWLENVPETCTDTESVLDYPVLKTAPLAETEPFGRNASLSDPVNRCDLVQKNDQLRNAKHKIGNSTYYRNASALVPVPENLELEHLLRSFSAHSISSYHLRRNHINNCNPVVFVSPTNSLKYLNSQFPLTYKTNDINSNYVMKSTRENVSKFSSAGVSDSLKSHTARSEIKLPHHSQTETSFTKCAEIPSNKKFHSPGFLKWLLDRFQHLRLSWRPSHLSCVEDQIMHPRKGKTSQAIKTAKDEYYVPSHPANQPPQNHAISYDSFSPSNLRRCFSLSDGGKSNKTNDQIIKNCSSRMEASFSSGILNAEINDKGGRKRSSCPSKQLHLSSQKDIHGNHSVASLTVSSVSFSKNHFLSQNHGIKSVPRLITSPPTLVRNFSKNGSNVSMQHSGRTSTMRDSGFVEGLHRPFISGSFVQSNFSKSSESSHMHHNPKSDSLRKASINSSNLWWYIGSSRLAPSIKASRPQFIASNNM